MSAHTWAILTGEYPPEPGGVSDYTYQVAGALSRAGDEVHVFAPRSEFASDCEQCGVIVHWLCNHYGAESLRQISETMDRLPRDARVLLQYVPHAFEFRAMNVGLCAWLAMNAARWNIGVMFHEVAFPIAAHQRLRHNFLGVVTHGMAMAVARSARRIFVSIPAWEQLLRPMIAAETKIIWLPVPSSLPRVADAQMTARIRREYTRDGEMLIGHFGSHTKLAEPVVAELLAPGRRRFISIGTKHIEGAICTGQLSAHEAAAHIAACDLMIQAYPDGISTRRSSAMAALALGKPVVSAIGERTEPLWRRFEAVALASTNESRAIARVANRVLSNPTERECIARNGKAIYESRFELRFTVDAIRQDDWR